MLPKLGIHDTPPSGSPTSRFPKLILLHSGNNWKLPSFFQLRFSVSCCLPSFCQTQVTVEEYFTLSKCVKQSLFVLLWCFLYFHLITTVDTTSFIFCTFRMLLLGGASGGLWLVEHISIVCSLRLLLSSTFGSSGSLTAASVSSVFSMWGIDVWFFHVPLVSS